MIVTLRPLFLRKVFLFFLLPSVVVILLTSCSMIGGQGPEMQEIYTMIDKPICRVAILPFQNESDYEPGGLILYRVFSAEMSSLTEIMVVPEGDIRHIYRQQRIYPSRPLDSEKIRILAERLDADAVITATVTEIREENSGGSINPVIGLNIKILDPSTGKIINSTYHKRNGDHYRKLMHFGKVSTITGLSKYMSREIIEAWVAKGIRSCQ